MVLMEKNAQRDEVVQDPLWEEPAVASQTGVSPQSAKGQSICPICDLRIGYYAGNVAHFANHTEEERKAVEDQFFMEGNFKRCVSCATVFWSTRKIASQWQRCAEHRGTMSYVPATPDSACTEEASQLSAVRPVMVARESAVAALPTQRPSQLTVVAPIQAALTCDLLHDISSWDVAVVPSIPKNALRSFLHILFAS